MVRSMTLHRLRRLTAGVAALTLLAAGAGLAPRTANAAASTTIAIDTTHEIGTLPADFVGLSYEMRELASFCTGDTPCTGNFDARQGNLVALYENLGRSNVRIGGNQLDRDTLWVPAGQQPPDPLPDWVKDVVTASDIARFDQVLKQTGWKAEVGINLAHYDPALAADEARTLYGTLGDRLVGAACGNEPNHYASNGYRPSPYGFPEHRADWEACADQVGSSRMAAPDLSSPHSTATWFDQFAHAEQGRIDMLTVHNYTGAKTIDELLSPTVHTSEVTDVAPQLASAKDVGIPIRVDETNSAVGGGIDGVSNVYASALWAMDYNLVMAQAGFAGLNFHGGFSVCDAPLFNGKFQRYTPICAANEQDMKAKIYKAMPEYYGLFMATRMGPGRFMPVTVSSDRNVTAYAVRGDDGRTRIAVIEKDGTSGVPVPVSIDVGGGDVGASVVHLTGQSLDSAAGVAVQGATVDRQGHLAPHPADHAHVVGGRLNIDVASGSAVIVTLGTG